MENILSLLIGLFTGSIITRQYDKYKERESDAHIYLLALREIGRFEDEINLWISGYPLGDDAIGKRQLLGTEYINKYLNSKLSTLLPVEPTAEIKHLTEWIYRFNNLLSSLSDEYTLKSKSVIEQIRGDAEAMDTCLQEKKVFIYKGLPTF